MKTNRLLSGCLCVMLIVLTSCAGENEQSIDSVLASGDLAQLKSFKEDLKAKERDLYAEIVRLDEAIDKLDTVNNYPLITTALMEEVKFEHFSEFQGNVMTDKNVVLYPEFSGTLINVKVKEGQRVSKGQLLASIDDGGMSQQRAAMQVQADLAKTTFERQSRLWEQKIGSELQYLQAKTNYESQQASLDQMDGQLAKTSIRAPFSGVVDEIISNQGSVVAPGMTPVMRIVSLKDMYVQIDVPEVHLPNIEKGRHVMIDLPVFGMTIDSEVRNVSSYVNPANRTFKVEVDVPNKEGRVKPNLNAKVKINDYTSDAAILVPQSVISEDAEGKEYVYVAKGRDGNVAEVSRAYVSLGKTQDDNVEVKQGLKAGDEIVLEGARSVSEGMTVEILN